MKKKDLKFLSGFSLIVAIIYSGVYFWMLLEGVNASDSELVVGVVFLSVPVIANWMTFAKLR